MAVRDRHTSNENRHCGCCPQSKAPNPGTAASARKLCARIYAQDDGLCAKGLLESFAHDLRIQHQS